ncbi:IS1595 family transposase [Endozoicomonas sp. ALD040]|uniref:IS1595 family transposase n=1 Tax=Endozoicomonas sp. ALD040 TaxID=3403079 RepID=UPI003BAF5221
MQYALFKSFLDAISTLTSHQKNILNKALSPEVETKTHQPNPSTTIQQKFSEHPRCPHCESDQIKRWGSSDGKQRYRCKSCHKTFNALTATPLARLRHPEKWQTYLNGMSHSTTLRVAASECGVTLRTSFRWRHRFLVVLEDDQGNDLGDIVELDETFLRESFKGQRSELPRPARQRGNDKKTDCRKIPVLVARDHSSRTVDGILANESASEMQQHLEGHLSSKVILCAEASLAHEKLARDMELPLKELVTSAGQHVIEGVFHIQHVNAYHSHLKGWIHGVFHGIATKYLKHYLGWRRVLTEATELTGERLSEKIAGHWFKQQIKAT